jgi:hypothetical protein
MRSLHRVLLISVIAVVFAASCAAQTAPESDPSPSEKIIRLWLQSGEPRLVAWGAHGALSQQNTKLIPDLLSLAGQWRPLKPESYTEGSDAPRLSEEQMDQRDAMAEVVDTLIQLKATVPSETLRNLAPDFGNAVAVLLSRMPVDESSPLAFAFYRNQEEHAYGLQYVSAALLAQHPPAGFAADLLTSVNVRANVFAVLPGTGAGSGGSAGDCFIDSDREKEGWPKSGQYILSRDNSEGALLSPGAMLLVAGIDPIYATRVERYHFYGDPCSRVVLRPEQRVRLIEEMLGSSEEDLRWQTQVTENIEFQSTGQFTVDLLAFVGKQQQMYRATAEALEAKGLMDKSEVQQSLPLLLLSLNDARGAGAEPITKEAIALPDRVEWAKY